MRTEKSYCNPLDLPYKYQHNPTAPSCREGADPTLILFKGIYYLFVSMSGGFWYSKDLLKWKFHENRSLSIYDYAPDACEIDGTLCFTASRGGDGNVILRTENPLSDEFEEIPTQATWWDPAMFHDDDGRTYLYWGCSNMNPIYGMEIDSQDFRQIGVIHELFGGQEGKNGYERAGENGIVKREGVLFELYDNFYDPVAERVVLPENFPVPEGMTKEMLEAVIPSAGRPYIEGPFMTKYEGKYYLQYSSPGTELNTYSNAVYVADYPLGPYTLQKSNPFSSKPGGFVCGAGHGSTLKDEYGNYWHVATMRISVNQSFERRVGLFPAGFDKEGVLFCNQNFGDYPVEIPQGRFDPLEIQPKYMLLSYKKSVIASSTADGSEAALAVNEDSRNWWSAGSSTPGEWLCVDLEEAKDIRAVQVNLADEDVHPELSDDVYVTSGYETRYIEERPQETAYTLEASKDGEQWSTLLDVEGDHPNGYFTFPEGIEARYVRIIGTKFPYGQPMRVSGLRIFGNGHGEKPEMAKASAKRVGTMDATVQWEKSKNAVGYNIRYGISPDKLYASWLVYEDCELSLSTLIEGVDYYISVDSFNENGITKGNVIQME